MANGRPRRLNTYVAPTTLLIAAALLAPERLAYVWISNRPGQFAQLISRVPALRDAGPITVVSYLFAAFKLLQATVFVAWCLRFGGGTIVVAQQGPLGLAAGALLVGLGQWLNVRVFALLGHDGVFYGNRFGITLPWLTAFPFNVVSHPQYVGAVLSIWGFFLAVRYPADDWYVLPVLESVYYALGAHFEA